MTLNDIAYWLTIRPRLNRLKKLLPGAVIFPAGSRYVCNPPVMHTDVDFLIYVPNIKTTNTEWLLTCCKYKESLMSDYRMTFATKPITCFRRGVVNLIVTWNEDYYRGFRTATHICKRFNVRHKMERVTVHEALNGAFDKGHDFWELKSYPELQQLILNFCGPHGATYHKVYRLQHGLDKETG